MITVSKNWLNAILSYAQRCGLQRAEVLLAAGIEAQALDQNDTRIEMDDMVRIWQACLERSDDDAFGLHMGEQIRLGGLQAVGYTLMNAATLGQALDKLASYQRLISEGGQFQRLPTNRGIWLIYHPRPQNLPFSFHQIDAVLAALTSLAKTLTERPLNALEVKLRRPAPRSDAEYQRIFGVKPQFNAEFDGLLIANAVLQLPLLESDPELLALHDQLARQQLLQLGQQISWSDRVTQLLAKHLQDNTINRDAVAMQLGLNSKTLQRRLASEGVSFSQLLDERREQQVCHLLEHSVLSLQAIALETGFADASALTRAFKRWRGTTPGQYRDSRAKV